MKAMIMALAMTVAATVSAEQTNTLEMLRQGQSRQQQSLSEQYGKALDTIIASLRKKGDLDNLLLVQAELDRFQAEKTVPVPTVAKDPFRPASEAYYRLVIALLEGYRKGLDELIKQEVMTGRIEEAKLARAEKEKADFMLADTRTKWTPPASNNSAEPKTDAEASQDAGARPFAIRSATYGAGKSRFDVKDILLDSINAGTPALQVGNTLFGEPAPGKPKTLRVEYTVGNVTSVIEVNEGETLNFGDLAETQSTTAGPPAGTGARTISIKSATYGAGKNQIDVKGVLLENIKGGTLEIQVGNALFGEPAPGKTKTLRVEYASGNVTGVIEKREGEILKLQNLVMPHLRSKSLSDGKMKRITD